MLLIVLIPKPAAKQTSASPRKLTIAAFIGIPEAFPLTLHIPALLLPKVLALDFRWAEFLERMARQQLLQKFW